MTANRGNMIERYVTSAASVIETAVSCRAAVFDKRAQGNPASWSAYAAIAELDPGMEHLLAGHEDCGLPGARRLGDDCDAAPSSCSVSLAGAPLA